MVIGVDAWGYFNFILSIIFMVLQKQLSFLKNNKWIFFIFLMNYLKKQNKIKESYILRKYKFYNLFWESLFKRIIPYLKKNIDINFINYCFK